MASGQSWGDGRDFLMLCASPGLLSVVNSERGRQISFDRDFSKPWWFE